MTEQLYEHDTFGHDDDSETNMVVCPVCGQPVNNLAVKELFTVDVVESDFRVRTLDDDILDTWLVFCHHCFYITHDFTQIPNELELVSDLINSDIYQQRFTDTNPTTLELFEHYLFMLEQIKAQPIVFADTYLRMSWLYEDDKNVKVADAYREKAIVQYAKALLIGNLDEKEKSMIYYYIAELSRRNSQFERAKKSILKIDISMFQHLFDFQTALIRAHNKHAVTMPREEN
ncbi:MAG: DUF2225 domain-containing protein [Candidatus Marinimicrobia bacterium]|nr:DUF2225 domain-containing protein [Candidatus Neomarinimicrobiota bacterium]